MTVRRHAAGVGCTLVSKINGSAGMGNHRITIAIAHAAFAACFPGFANGIGCQIRKDLQVFKAGINIHAVGGFLRRFVQRHGRMGMGGIHNDGVARNLGILSCHRILHFIDIHMIKAADIHRA